MKAISYCTGSVYSTKTKKEKKKRTETIEYESVAIGKRQEIARICPPYQFNWKLWFECFHFRRYFQIVHRRKQYHNKKREKDEEKKKKN